MELSEPVKDEQNAEGNAVEQPSRKRRNPFLTSKEDKERRQKKKARIVVRNISYKANEDLLSKHFSQWGNVEELNLLKRPDGKLVGCAFVQYSSVNQASKAILRGNKQDFLGRPIYVDWALGKDEYIKKNVKEEPDEKKPKKEPKEEDGIKLDDTLKEEDQDSESQEDDDESDDKESNADESTEDDKIVSNSDDDEKKSKSKLEIGKVGKETHISNDVQDGCTIFIKNVPFDAENNDLRKIFRKFGLLHYAIINREPISGHSKGTAFVKFKNKESADLCLQSGGEISLMDQLLEPYPALSRDEVRNNEKMKSNKDVAKDSRNLYLAREGLIMANSKSAEGVSASDMSKRHKLEQIKTQVLKNLNRFVSRNRLSIHNLPMNYDNEKLKRMVITYTDFRPHECRVMRENKITPEHPQGKSKGFGFMSFSTHQEALAALRKLNNNPSVFGNQHRPIVAFSIEDRAVEKVKENRKQKSKINNPTFKEKLEKRKEQRRLKRQGKLAKNNNKIPYTDDKEKLKKHIKKLEESRAAKANAQAKNPAIEELDNFVGTASKPGSNIRLRSNKKIAEQAQEHRKNVKANKRKEKAKKIRQIHLAERKAIERPKQGRKEERDDLEHLVTKYKRMIDSQANVGGTGENLEKELKAPKRTKWYTE